MTETEGVTLGMCPFLYWEEARREFEEDMTMEAEWENNPANSWRLDRDF
jgi:hypothetical protein